MLAFVAVEYGVAAVAAVVFADGRPAPGVGLLVKTGLWVVLDVSFYYLLAIAIAGLLGSRAYTIGVLLAWRLAIGPLLASISALGIVRELVPGVAMQALTPVALGDTARQGPDVGMSLAAITAVLVVWTLVAQLLGASRDTTRDA